MEKSAGIFYAIALLALLIFPSLSRSAYSTTSCKENMEYDYALVCNKSSFALVPQKPNIQKPDKEFRELEDAARKGNAEAQYNLGIMYENGYGVTQNHLRAVKWYRRAALNEHVAAQYNLGVMYLNGTGVEQNFTTAKNWLQKAAEHDFMLAQHNLGVMYFRGDGVEQNGVDAAKWHLRAAKQGSIGSQCNLGIMYANGFGVNQNYKLAVSWFRKAAEGGCSGAQHNLAILYSLGLGVPKDIVRAYMFFYLAEKNGCFVSVETRNKVSRKMTTEQIMEAQEMATEWLTNHGLPFDSIQQTQEIPENPPVEQD